MESVGEDVLQVVSDVLVAATNFICELSGPVSAQRNNVDNTLTTQPSLTWSLVVKVSCNNLVW